MQYEYHIYRPGSREDIAAIFSTTEPLPGIQVGHHLMLENHEHSTKLGTHLAIREVEAYLFVTEGYQLQTCRISVFVDVEERTPLR